MKIVFMGTPEFAVASLEAILEQGHEVVCVVTQPDKPKGRGGRLASPPVKEVAVQRGIQVYQPPRIRETNFVERLRNIKPDIIVVTAFGQILPKSVLDIPPKGCINVHASLLPKYRGAAPIQFAIINGESQTGITTMYMDEGMDTGDMILQRAIDIHPDETAGQLHDRLAVLSKDVLKDTLVLIEQGRAPRIKQNDNEATYCSKLTKEMGHINWNADVKTVYNLIRGVTPWPGAYAFYEDTMIKIWHARIVSDYKDALPGQIVDIHREYGIIIKCENGCVAVDEVQQQNKKRMNIEEYLRGHKIEIGTMLR
ncbi:methionyl-tRNA formyltransferase [Mahella australiensis]|uniref:Methionyl-tRNA formyltransferase n=1 Tax=Mahella australiensis (strain DSM 15567 / CIP 107919 / 50-1 BON) TaxID=697281 RepID=F4A2D5_MAHA5|nr:methionyl-tRNA formyltransferase [Mahella australiensis]AEE96182.1 methionyl-tRNA formyltransferase [Mahella australiensis 50-1 BON]